MLGERDLAAIVATVERSFPDVVWRHRPTLAADAAGGRTKTWVRTSLGIPARIVAAGGDEAQVADRALAMYDFTIHVPADAQVAPSDRLELPDGRLAEILAVAHGGGWDPSQRITAKVVRA